MIKHRFATAAIATAALFIGACNDSNNKSDSGPRVIAKIAIPNITSTSNFSFDLGTVDAAKGLYYFTDRNNASVDVIDTRTNSLVRQVKGFAGCNTGPTCAGANNDKSGPNGIDVIPGTPFLFVGDVNAVRVVDTNSWTIVNTIKIGDSSGLRADEGCYDPDHNIYMISSPGETPPFATFIDVTTQKIIATVVFTDPGTGLGGPPSAGLEACQYDHATASFFVNNDGSSANPHGELDVIPASAILVGTPAAPVVLTLPAEAPGNGFHYYPEGNCDPTGLALGPGTDIAISCREGTPNAPLLVLFMNRTTGAIIATANLGGGDQIVYDAASNRYYYAASRWTQNGLSSGAACGAAHLCFPTLFIIDAATHQQVASLTTGNNAHSVAIDPVQHKIFLPYSSAAAPGGSIGLDQNPEGGVLVFASE